MNLQVLAHINGAGQFTAVNSLRKSAFARPFETIYGVLNCQRRWRVGRVIVEVIRRLEGGYMHSHTARKLLKQFHQVEIGAYSYGPCFYPGYFPPDVSIGRFTSIAAGVKVVNENHPIDGLSTHPFGYIGGSRRHPLLIGHDVWIGFNAIILPGCSKIGTGAILGAGAIVTKDVPPYAIVAGNPARLIRPRFSEEVIARLLESRWWNKPLEDIDFSTMPNRAIGK